MITWWYFGKYRLQISRILVDGLMSKEFICWTAQGISPPFLKVWLMEKDRKVPCLRCVLGPEFCIDYRLW